MNRLNYEKCVIGARSMECLGEGLTREGLQFSRKRVEAIVDQCTKTPKSIKSEKLLRMCPILCQIHPWIFHNIRPLVGSGVPRLQTPQSWSTSSKMIRPAL